MTENFVRRSPLTLFFEYDLFFHIECYGKNQHILVSRKFFEKAILENVEIYRNLKSEISFNDFSYFSKNVLELLDLSKNVLEYSID